MIVYKITNKITGKKYIGQTVSSINERWSQHKSDAMSRNRKFLLHNAIRKYLPENFEIAVISKCASIEEMNHREQYYIKLFNTLAPNGYNLDLGGLGHIRTKETKEKISSIRKNTKLSEETKKKISESLLGEKNHNFNKKMSEYTKNKISIANKGRMFSDSIKQKWSEIKKGDKNSFFGKHHTEETKKYLSDIRLGISTGPRSEETKLKQSLARKDKVKIKCNENDQTYDSIKSAARELSIPSNKISQVVNGKRKSVKGFTFRRVS